MRLSGYQQEKHSLLFVLREDFQEHPAHPEFLFSLTLPHDQNSLPKDDNELKRIIWQSKRAFSTSPQWRQYSHRFLRNDLLHILHETELKKLLNIKRNYQNIIEHIKRSAIS